MQILHKCVIKLYVVLVANLNLIQRLLQKASILVEVLKHSDSSGGSDTL